MAINWQDVFYITASLTMVVVFVTCIWLIWFSFLAFKLVRNIEAAIRVGINIIEDVGYFRKGIKLKVLSFLLKILEKGLKFNGKIDKPIINGGEDLAKKNRQ